MMMDDHTFTPLRVSPGVVAACSCGWTSAYTHAVTRYARDDHDFHVSLQEADHVATGVRA
jgi:hypothetical protein